MAKLTRLEKVLLALVLLAQLPLYLVSPDGSAPRSEQAFWDLGHFALFAACGFLVAGPLSRWRGFRLPLLAVVLLPLAALSGVAIEYIQREVGRDFSMWDVAHDVMGCAIGLYLVPEARAGVSRAVRGIALGLAILLTLWALQPISVALYDEQVAADQFPVLADFSTPFEWQRFGGKAEVEPRPGLHPALLPVRFQARLYSNLELKYFRQNWSAYRWLRFEVINTESGPVRLGCVIEDHHYTLVGGDDNRDRFKTHFLLKPGLNTLRIDLDRVRQAPVGRTMDMQQISRLSFFTFKLQRPVLLDFGRIELSNE